MNGLRIRSCWASWPLGIWKQATRWSSNISQYIRDWLRLLAESDTWKAVVLFFVFAAGQAALQRLLLPLLSQKYGDDWTLCLGMVISQALDMIFDQTWAVATLRTEVFMYGRLHPVDFSREKTAALKKSSSLGAFLRGISKLSLIAIFLVQTLGPIRGLFGFCAVSFINILSRWVSGELAGNEAKFTNKTIFNHS